MNKENLKEEQIDEKIMEEGQTEEAAEMQTSSVEEEKGMAETDEVDKDGEAVSTPKKQKNRSEKIRKSFTSKQFQSGAYSSVITVLVIAIVVVINMVFAKLDLSTDLSKGSLFTLSKDTREILKDNTKKITLNYMVSSGQEQDYIENVLEQYAKESKQIRIKKTDPVVNPGFASKYNISDEITSNDVIVVNEENDSAKYVSANEMLYSKSDYSSYYNQNSSNYLDVEGQITSAIQNVLAENKTKMYVVSGHGEQELAATLVSAYEKMNIEKEDLALLTAKEIPSDCDILYFNGPTTDLSDNEKTVVLNYLKKGGDSIINLSYSTQSKEQPNFGEILEYYGMQSTQGLICEGAGHYSAYPNYIVPALGSSELVSSMKGQIIVLNSIGLNRMTEIRSSLQLEELLTTSEESYLKVDPSSGTAEKESGDIDGPFTIGISAKESVDDGETKLIVFSSADSFSETCVADSPLENGDLIKNAVGSMLESEVQKVAIDPKSLDYSYISLPVMAQMVWFLILLILLPLAVLIFGFVIWLTRRKL